MNVTKILGTAAADNLAVTSLQASTLQVTNAIAGINGTGNVSIYDSQANWNSDTLSITKTLQQDATTSSVNHSLTSSLSCPWFGNTNYAIEVEWVGIIKNVTGGASTGCYLSAQGPSNTIGMYIYEFGSSTGNYSTQRGAISSGSAPQYAVLAGAAAGSTSSFRIVMTLFNINDTVTGTINLGNVTFSNGGTWTILAGSKMVARRSILI